MDAALKLPFSGRINLRMVVFAGTLLFLLTWPVYTFVSETLTRGIHNHGSYKEVDLKAMCFFRIDPHTATLKDVPAAYRALDGQKVLLKGLVDPTRESGPAITEFTILYSRVCQCQLGGPPQVQEKVFATAALGRTLRYAGDQEYEVLGTLHVTMKHDEVTGEVVEVYHLDAQSIKPL